MKNYYKISYNIIICFILSSVLIGISIIILSMIYYKSLNNDEEIKTKIILNEEKIKELNIKKSDIKFSYDYSEMEVRTLCEKIYTYYQLHAEEKTSEHANTYNQYCSKRNIKM